MLSHNITCNKTVNLDYFSGLTCVQQPGSYSFSRETFSSRKKISLRNCRVYGPLYTYTPLYCVNTPTRKKKDNFVENVKYKIIKLNLLLGFNRESSPWNDILEIS